MTMDPKTAEYVLLLYAQKELGRKKAMFYLGVGYAELLQLVADRGLAVPVLDDAEIDTMATTFAAVLESRRNQLAFVIPDGGPIIRLAIGDRLDVLLALQLPLYIVDQVKREMVRDSGREDARRIATFFADHADIVHEFETSVNDDEATDSVSSERPQQRGLTLKAVDEAWSRPIGPRHTNLGDGSICAFSPDDGAWSEGSDLRTLLDLYSVWTLRHLHLEVLGRWPGKQYSLYGVDPRVQAFYRQRECKDNELCACGSETQRYADCCKPLDLQLNVIELMTLFSQQVPGGFSSRRPPAAVVSFIEGRSALPRIANVYLQIASPS